MKTKLLPILPLSIVLLNTIFLHSPVLGVGALVWYICLFLSWGKQVSGDYISSAIILITYTILTNALIYYTYGTTGVTSVLVLTLSWLFFWLPSKEDIVDKAVGFFTRWKRFVEDIQHPFRDAKIVFLTTFVAFLDTTLLGLLWSRRTVDLMPSPWQAVTGWFFIIFTLSTILLIYTIAKHRYRNVAIALISLHLFTLYAIAPLLYPLGYGFDAFIHRATETWIFQNGFILPKQPYYIGQYSLVVFLAHITRLPLFWIDVLLVPILATTLIPAFVTKNIKRIWPEMKTFWQIILTLGIALIPFLSFHLTTPHNLVMVLSLLTIFATLASQRDNTRWYLPFLLTLTALITHPLIGAPIFGFVLTAWIISKTDKIAWKTVWLTLASITQLFLLPLMFTLNNLRTGHGLPTFGNPFTALPHFLELFARPYWYLQHAPIKWEMLYAYERMIIPLAIIFAIIGFILSKKKKVDMYLYPATAFAIFLSAWLLRSWVTFPDVVVYEQGDYPMRLIRASMLFLLPWFLYGIYLFFEAVKKPLLKKILFIGFAAALTISFYFSYPQRNIKARFPGFNVTQADFEAVKWIHENAQDEYIVLANQLVSAAALTEYGFAKSYDTSLGELFYYSVPTGGPLYAQYGKMLYEGQERQFMKDAMILAGVDSSYFVIDSYWAKADEIIEGAKKTADSWQIIDEGNVWIFEYTQKQLPQ